MEKYTKESSTSSEKSFNEVEEDVISSDEQEEAEEYCKGGYYCLQLGDILKNRYYIIRKLGWGQFSTVWLAWDIEENYFVGVKIVKSALQYTEAALDEISILKKIREANPADPKRERIIQLLNYFKESGENGSHMCMIFQVLGSNLLKLITDSDYKGIAINQVKIIIRQILEGLCYLHDTCGIIHCDIKPENILLAVTKDQVKKMAAEAFELVQNGETLPTSFICSASKRDKRPGKVYWDKLKRQILHTDDELVGSFSNLPTCLKVDKNEYKRQLLFSDQLDHSSVVIADLGNACWTNNHFSDEIQTRQYRSIEVILGANYGTAADVWSVGCMAYELATGSYLFNAHSNETASTLENHIAMIASLLGPIPKHVALNGNASRGPFTKTGELRSELVLPPVSLEKLLKEEANLDAAQAKAFAEFLKFVLRVDQVSRPSVKQCLEHPWLN